MKASPVVLFRLLFLSMLTFVIIIASFDYAVGVDGLISLKVESMKRRQEKRARLFGQQERRYERERYLAKRNYLRNRAIAMQQPSIANPMQHQRKEELSGPSPIDFFKNMAMRSLDHLKSCFPGMQTNLSKNV